MEVLEKAGEMERKGEDIIHLEIGEPDFDTPECIKEAASRAMREGKTKYTHSLGLIELREAICEHYRDKYGVEITPAQVLITSGTSPAMLLLFSALLNPGDEVVITDPHYPCYPNFVSLVDGVPSFVNVYEAEGFQYRPEEIRKKINPKTKGIVINSPSNPTGNLLSAERMKEIAELGLMVISDEIYHGLVYEGKEHCILEFTDRAFVLNGFSKLYAMTGWRLGYVIAPQEFARPMQKLQQNLFISANCFVQLAGIAALREASQDVARMRETYDTRRRYMLKRLQELGFGISSPPTGAFYILANAKRFNQDSYRFAFDILKQARVAVTPGIDFGRNAEGYLRFSYAVSLEKIQEGMERLEKYLADYR